ncbi:hypothetical protein P689_122126 [Candidatus Riesia pediculischaeffi PTSU]|uniref:Uncharacterized protein n=1 Tax=Candidatus Riesia pediculischaeffi PTSU TaxID=1401651 RepID=A0A0C1S071_9ENTR|nr:hypothetical protein P689_122126 [Candidatus Riesia pediculischaeffi PTSU]
MISLMYWKIRVGYVPINNMILHILNWLSDTKVEMLNTDKNRLGTLIQSFSEIFT